jgi:hypothetical protein
MSKSASMAFSVWTALRTLAEPVAEQLVLRRLDDHPLGLLADGDHPNRRTYTEIGVAFVAAGSATGD